MPRNRTYRATTEGIRVHVRSRYESEFSRPEENRFIFSYRIIIENRSHKGIKVMRRQWHIVDAMGHRRKVVGNGVVGVQPDILPGRVFEYDSACDLRCEMGQMSGSYTVQYHDAKKDSVPFEVRIPAFSLEAPWMMS
jgi:ApaG protein